MLIALYYFLMAVALPQLVAIASALLESVTILIITLAGIVMLFGAVGIKISNNLGSTIVTGIFRAIGYLVRTLVSAVGWLARNLLRLMPFIFHSSRRFLTRIGMNRMASNLVSAGVTALVVLLII